VKGVEVPVIRGGMRGQQEKWNAEIVGKDDRPGGCRPGTIASGYLSAKGEAEGKKDLCITEEHEPIPPQEVRHRRAEEHQNPSRLNVPGKKPRSGLLKRMRGKAKTRT